jgi:hypothetical protein
MTKRLEQEGGAIALAERVFGLFDLRASAQLHSTCFTARLRTAHEAWPLDPLSGA